MILIVDPSPESAAHLAQPLRETGREVRIAAGGPEALAELAGFTPQLVILDLAADSPALSNPLIRRGVPVLLVSSESSSRLPEAATPRGWKWMAKPVEPDALVMTVSLVLGRQPQGGQGSQAPNSGLQAPADPGEAPRPTGQLVAETLVDLVACLILGGVLLWVKPESPWVQGGCVVGILLLAGVRAADLVAVSKGMPPRGGPAALLMAMGGAWAARHGVA